MSYFQTKTLIALLFMVAGVTALVSMLTLMGRSERRLGVLALRTTHRTAGYVFAGLLVAAAVMGLRYLAVAGDGLPLRGVIHWTAASLLIVVLGLKIVIVRFYKQFVKFVPVFGLIVFSLAFVVVVVSAVFFLVTGGAAGAERLAARAMSEERPDAAGTGGDPARGEALFGSHCAFCHDSDTEETKVGPGLSGLLSRAELPASGRPATPENVRAQLVAPAGTMPSFADLREDELSDLVAYLDTL
jgi:mono/diheme cytochrome c family protein